MALALHCMVFDTLRIDQLHLGSESQGFNLGNIIAVGIWASARALLAARDDRSQFPSRYARRGQSDEMD